MITEPIASEIAVATPAEARAYLLGASHDATLSSLHHTTRFCQAEANWLEVLSVLLDRIGSRSWIYKEGRDRNVWILETSWSPQLEVPTCDSAKAAYLRGYFDAEGGIPRVVGPRFYIQFVQKDRDDLLSAQNILLELGIRCGRAHNPSVRVDPEYWRFYVASRSHLNFIDRVGSWHPRKRARLETERAGKGTASRI